MDTLVTTAIIGTRQAQRTENILTGTEIDQFASFFASESPERQILLTAGAVSIYKQAGQIITENPRIFASALPENQKISPAKAVPLLTRIFVTSKYALLRGQTISILNEQHLIISPVLVPILLSRGNLELSERSQIAKIVGQRGRWLSRFKDEWSWILKFDSDLPENWESIWQEGSLEERTDILEKFRAVSPVKAADLLQNVWKQEKADVRAKFLTTLEIGLSHQDEFFLEQALADRAEKVRKIASSLLSRLNRSHLTQRMLAAADTFIQYQNNTLIVTEPTDFVPAWEQDGILSKPQQNLDAKMWWVKQILARIPPQHWEHVFELSAADCIKAIQTNTTWSNVFLESITESALVYKDLNWIIPLWDWLSTTTKINATQRQQLTSLSPFIPQDIAERRVLFLMAANIKWTELLTLLPKPWSISFSQEYLQLFRQHIDSLTEEELGYNDFYDSMRPFTLGLHPSTIASAIQPFELPKNEAFNLWRDLLDTFTTLSTTRKELLNVLGLE